MRFSAVFTLAAAGLAAAQSTTSASAPSSSVPASGCGHAVDLIIEACLQTLKPALDACGGNDWGCLCTNIKNVLTCYNNCPGDQSAYALKQEETSWCQAAALYSTTSTTYSAATATGGSATAASSASKTHNGAHTGFASASGSGSASASASPSNAAAGLTPAGGLVAAIFGLALL